MRNAQKTQGGAKFCAFSKAPRYAQTANAVLEHSGEPLYCAYPYLSAKHYAKK